MMTTSGVDAGMGGDETTEQAAPAKSTLLGIDRAALQALALESGEARFRGDQLYEWIYTKGARSFDEMSNLPRKFRVALEGQYAVGQAKVAEVRVSTDGSRKMLLRLADGKIVESVLMPERDWVTLCISSQVGCAVACTFCMTGFGGFRRQMTTGEIVSQVLLAKTENGGEIPRNLVFMGMGEPMLNLDAVIPAIKLLTDPDGIGMSPRRITVSTSGILPGIERLGVEDLGVNIAISLNASNDEFRDTIMPINKRWPIASLLDACRAFPLRRRRLITFEYVLLGGLNDSVADAEELAELVADLPCKINLIPWNPDPHLPYQRSEEAAIRKFQEVLLDSDHAVSIRYSKALDVGGACGQLAGHWEAEKRAQEGLVRAAAFADGEFLGDEDKDSGN